MVGSNLFYCLYSIWHFLLSDIDKKPVSFYSDCSVNMRIILVYLLTENKHPSHVKLWEPIKQRNNLSYNVPLCFSLVQDWRVLVVGTTSVTRVTQLSKHQL